MTPEEIRMMEQKRIQEALSRKNKIAQSQAASTPIQQQQRPLQAGQMGGQQSPLQQFGMQIGQKLLGGLLGGGVGFLGFNKGGMVKGYNMGGPLAKHPNPHGYNEGGAVMETPLKKVMDEQKLMQQQVAFDMEQKRKQEAHDLTMQQKKQQFAQAQKMKQESATTKMSPKKPLAK